ncbi:MAG: HEPN domain-containing protein [Promethearchaeota archaeon]|nr:MAG: HEPN domain-containing protein [Candidatus Lokiarchaeota archaeon]
MTEFNLNSLVKKANRFIKTSIISIEDGDYDSGASRGYYAMSFMARAVLLSKNIKPKTHSGVISMFGEHFVKNQIFPKEMGRSLNEAFELRLIEDYDFTKEIS